MGRSAASSAASRTAPTPRQTSAPRAPLTNRAHRSGPSSPPQPLCFSTPRRCRWTANTTDPPRPAAPPVIQLAAFLLEASPPGPGSRRAVGAIRFPRAAPVILAGFPSGARTPKSRQPPLIGAHGLLCPNSPRHHHRYPPTPHPPCLCLKQSTPPSIPHHRRPSDLPNPCRTSTAPPRVDS